MKALASAGWNVKVFDATPDPAALNGGWRNENGRPVEAGFKVEIKSVSKILIAVYFCRVFGGSIQIFSHFWTNLTLRFLCLHSMHFLCLNGRIFQKDEVLTPFTRSGLYNPKGLYTQAPIFSDFPRSLSARVLFVFENMKMVTQASRPVWASVVHCPDVYRPSAE